MSTSGSINEVVAVSVAITQIQASSAITAAAPQNAAPATAPSAPAPAEQNTPAVTIPEDTVTISPAARELALATTSQLRVMRDDGESIQTIAEQLDLTTETVQSYLGEAARAATA